MFKHILQSSLAASSVFLPKPFTNSLEGAGTGRVRLFFWGGGGGVLVNRCTKIKSALSVV